MPRVELEIASPSAQTALANMLQLYIHDFSELWGGEARGELGEDGLFEAPDLAELWPKADHLPLLIRADGHLAGFCILNAHAHGAQPVDRNVAEFFVVRKHRRSGVGAAAARAVFSAHPGTWEVAVVQSNTGALIFWRKVIEAQPGMSGFHELGDVRDWNGTVFRFCVG
jgi:predicted acetyltransferase